MEAEVGHCIFESVCTVRMYEVIYSAHASRGAQTLHEKVCHELCAINSLLSLSLDLYTSTKSLSLKQCSARFPADSSKATFV